MLIIQCSTYVNDKSVHKMLWGENWEEKPWEGYWGPRKDFLDKTALTRKLKGRIKIVQAKEKRVMTKANSIKGTISVKILLDSNYWETMVRNVMEDQGKGPTHSGPWISQIEDSTLGHLKDRKPLKAFNLRSNMTKLVFQLKVESRGKTGCPARGRKPL